MNGDMLGSLLRQVLTTVLASGAGAAYINHDQATSIAAGVGTLVSVGWSIWSHWGMKKVKA